MSPGFPAAVRTTGAQSVGGGIAGWEEVGAEPGRCGLPAWEVRLDLRRRQ